MVVAFAAGFGDEANAIDAHGSIDGFEHIDDGQRGDGHGGEGFHFDAGLGGDGCGGGDADAVGFDDLKIDGGLIQAQGMAEGNQLAGFFGGHDAGDSGGVEHLAFGGVACGEDLQSLRLHDDEAFGSGLAQGGLLGGNIDHAGGAGVIDMGEIGHEGRIQK